MRYKIDSAHTLYRSDKLLKLIEKKSNPVTMLSKVQAVVRIWQLRRRNRKQMARDMRNFTDAVFQDFGITKQEALKEVSKHFWQA